jgi:hypothetical protein
VRSFRKELERRNFAVVWTMTVWRTEPLMIEMRMLLLIPYILVLTMDPAVLTVNGTSVVEGQLLVWTLG